VLEVEPDVVAPADDPPPDEDPLADEDPEELLAEDPFADDEPESLLAAAESLFAGLPADAPFVLVEELLASERESVR
jgi:hypothetical protein